MANIHSFESLAALDGKGLRYAVFFTGCPLRCVYCHNPDTWHKSETDMTAEELFRKIRRYKPYFRNGGGVTFSGGEPLLNADFINEISPLLKAEGIGYCLDTSGSVELTGSVKTAIEGADMIILDIKFADKEKYEKYTGGDFRLPLETAEYCTRKGKTLRLRTVVVPGINDNEKEIKKYAAFIKENGIRYEEYELLAFHTMGFFKYERLGIENKLRDTPALSKHSLDELQKILDGELNVTA
ncbi:MAG: radical SAM protein [Clostridia bacterium]|nr:radical SAM protein [Clostridia bacterium]